MTRRQRRSPERGQRLGQVMLDELDALVVGEARACRLEHELGEIKAHTVHLGAIDTQQGEQAAVTGPEVEDATSVARNMLKQHAFSLGARRRQPSARSR
jgi:hypothetical protein